MKKLKYDEFENAKNLFFTLDTWIMKKLFPRLLVLQQNKIIFIFKFLQFKFSEEFITKKNILNFSLSIVKMP